MLKVVHSRLFLQLRLRRRSELDFVPDEHVSIIPNSPGARAKPFLNRSDVER